MPLVPSRRCSIDGIVGSNELCNKGGVSRLRSLLIALLVLGWLPATSHCLIEQVWGVEEEGCCHEASDSGAPNDSECPACVSLETGLIHQVGLHIAALPPVLRVEDELASILAALARVESSAAEPIATGRDDVPAPLWSFVVSTALPVRGPSSVA